MTAFSCYEEENIAYWTRRTSGYSGVNREELSTKQRKVWGDLLAERIKACFPNRPSGDIHVLDVGTGPGFFAVILAERGYSVTAVDYTASMLDAARENAGPLAKKIKFRQMNAEELTFPENSFDVLVSRNLTWNLPNPEAAYRQWHRVLRPNGLLLNFDANWYGYLKNDMAHAAHIRDRANICKAGVDDETAGTDVAAMESIALKAPLSGICRPLWDADALAAFGMSVRADEEIWRRVWTYTERVNNASTPMFMIEAVKSNGAPA